MTDKAYAVPLHEQLASVPRDARLIIDDADGMGTRFIPVGRMCHEAAEALQLAQPEPAECDGGQCGIGGYCKQCPKTQPEQEPIVIDPNGTIRLLKHLPQREWQGLTDEEGYAIFEEARHGSDRPIGVLRGIRAIEAKLKEKNA